MKKYMITLNDKVYEVDIEEVIEAVGKEKSIITKDKNNIYIDVNEDDGGEVEREIIHIK